MENGRKIRSARDKPESVQRDVSRTDIKNQNKADMFKNVGGIKSGQSYSGVKLRTGTGGNKSSPVNQRFLLKKSTKKYTAGRRIQTAQASRTGFGYKVSHGSDGGDRGIKTRIDSGQDSLYSAKYDNSTAVLSSGMGIRTSKPSKSGAIGINAGIPQTRTAVNTGNDGIKTAVTLKTDALQHSVNSGEIKTGAESRQTRNVKGIKTNGLFLQHKRRLKNKRYSLLKTDYSIFKNDTVQPSAIKTQVKSDVSDSVNISDIQRRRSVYKRALRIKQMRLKNLRYTIAKPDGDNSPAIESVMAAHAAVSAGVQAGGHIRTAVKKTAGAAGRIATAVKYDVPVMKVGSAKDAGRIMTAAGSGLKNAVKGTGNQILKTKPDESKITDTGTESVKQGITGIRHASNTGKAVVNTARTSVKTAYAIKNMPRDTRAQVRRAKQNAKKAAETAKKTAKAAKKAGTVIIRAAASKPGLIIIAAILLIMLTTTLLSGLTTVTVTSVTSLFSWMFPDEEDSGRTEKDVLDGYQEIISDYLEQKQAEIDSVVNMEPEYITYPPYSQIQGLNRFGESELSVDRTAVLAVLAVQRYKELGSDAEELKLEFKESEIQEAIEKFYDFTYSYSYGECPGGNCIKTETQEVVNAGTPYEYTLVTVTYSCHGNHKYLDGSVTNLTVEEVMEALGFTDEETELYYLYYAQIKTMFSAESEETEGNNV